MLGRYSDAARVETGTARKKVAIVQSNYIPWKGYFDLINMVDEFILFDDMQYTRRDWRNRNLIKTAHGLQWLTIPVEVKGRYYQKINETRVSDSSWTKSHWQTLAHNYSRAPHFKTFAPVIEQLYGECREVMLSKVNYKFMRAICEILGIRTRLSWSMDHTLLEGKTERLVALCKAVGASEYLSGPTARGYLDETQFQMGGIKLSYMDYSGYPPYPQLFGAFEHGVTILDLMFNVGPDAPRFMKSSG